LQQKLGEAALEFHFMPVSALIRERQAQSSSSDELAHLQ
jgi:hypothetical protein